jgi:hypothetical protein
MSDLYAIIQWGGERPPTLVVADVRSSLICCVVAVLEKARVDRWWTPRDELRVPANLWDPGAALGFISRLTDWEPPNPQVIFLKPENVVIERAPF